MPLNVWPWMSLQKEVKIIAIIDFVWSSLMVAGVVINFVELLRSLVSDDATLVIPKEHVFTIVFAFVIVGLIFVAQLVAAFSLYKAANRNNESRLWPWIIVAAITMWVFVLGILVSIHGSSYGDAVLVLVFTIYKVYAVMVVVKFKSSMTSQEGVASYSASREKQGNANVYVV
ncbi:hypothetical protein Ocin01_12799 [Orchesella cincta]|uniref:Uncharacterized protein n=1 Tax=Orchesella cincta TaxID=48709 RepID=A0A1D2MLY2_ORCCI|nr:hypothetical protein Ocin01_12799 [Orchesella cincta]